MCTTLSEFIRDLQKLESEGHGDKPVFAIVSGSGAAYEVNSSYLEDK